MAETLPTSPPQPAPFVCILGGGGGGQHEPTLSHFNHGTPPHSEQLPPDEPPNSPSAPPPPRVNPHRMQSGAQFLQEPDLLAELLVQLVLVREAGAGGAGHGATLLGRLCARACAAADLGL